MKKSILLTGILCTFLLFGGTALALTINSGAIDVGVVDDVFTSATIANSLEAEEQWIQDELGETWTLTKDDNPGLFTQVDGETTIYAGLLNSPVDYYLVRIGTGGLPAGTDSHWLYTNNASKNYAVLDYTDWGTSQNIDIFRISHIGEANGVSVPEPASMFLLGTGLLGLVVVRRRSKK
jgi:hypothetical protein